MKKMTLILAFALVTILGAAPAKAVEFGDEIESASTDYPWVASIWHSGPKDDYYYPICSGSLITQDAVLTAAHCLTRKGIYLVQMASDTLNGESEDTFYEIAAIWKHPRYDNETLINDVGLLKLTTFQNEVKPMAFAAKADLAAVRNIKKFEMFGWGNDQYGNYAKFLGYTKLKNLTKVAGDVFEVDDFNPISTIAAGRYIKRLGVYAGSGDGDSGGPLVATIKGVKKIVGITSWGQQGDDFKAPTAFVNVSYQRTAIAEGLATLQRLVTVAARLL
jgi:secreted trypsin-like serine protease